jgi:hypothetical protein
MKFLTAFIAALSCLSPAWAAIAFVAAGAHNTSNTKSVALSTPAGIANNNLEIMTATIVDSNGLSTITTPSGWTLITYVATPTAVYSAYMVEYAFYRVAASEPASYTVSGVAGSGSTVYGMAGDIRGYSGTATSSPVISYVSAANTGLTVPALSETFISGEWYVAAYYALAEQNPTSVAPALSHLVDGLGGNNGTASGAVSWYLGDLVPSSAPGTQAFTLPNGSGQLNGQAAIGLSIKPSSGVVAHMCARDLLGVGC